MERDTSFLFAGIKFDRKRFAKDFEKFKVKRESDDPIEEPSMVQNENVETEKETISSKKRKRKATPSEADLDSAKGITIFKSSTKAEDVSKDKDEEDNAETQHRKEVNRKIERDALLRKKYNIHISGSNVASPLQEFSELSSSYKCKPYLLQNMAELGFKEPTPIQRQAIPILLSVRSSFTVYRAPVVDFLFNTGRECFACAPTGSGKTLAFVCPMLIKLKRPLKAGIRGVILCPTRELAAQTTRECKKFAKGKKFYIRLMTKELARNSDFSKLRCDILIATPLRLQYAVRKRKLDLSRVEYLVLDESDKLFELGLVKQIDSVVKACSNPSIVRALFSATLPDYVEELARTIMHDAVRVIIGRKNSASELVKQRLLYAGSEEGKLIGLRQSFSESLNPPVLVFVQSKERAKQLYDELLFDDIRVGVIHADLDQKERENAVDDFRGGKTWVLIATDVVARGMDFKGVNCVINYDFPDSASVYIHRIGRTGRAGRTGEAITFYTDEDFPYLRNIANAITASGNEVPVWIKTMPKLKWKKHRPKRDSISTGPDV